MTSKLFAVVALALVAGSLATTLSADQEWSSFKLKFGKKYASDVEEARRYAIFRNHLEFITKHNEEFSRGLHTYTTGINEFCDLSTEEFVAQMNGLRVNPDKVRRLKELPTVGTLPTTVDWRTKGVVTPIKNQGQCGSCWSFSATGSTEGQHALTTGNLVSLSEQNLVDCSTAEGNDGCQGGLMDQAFEYIIKNNGIDTEASYPYTATGPNKCKYNPANKGATLVSYHDLPSKDEDALQQASATIGPISVGIDASHQSFQVYSSGVYYEPACSETQLDHGVLCVGYGVDNGQDYWLVKNSWGTTWGMAGYIEMSRNRNNNCGIATDASYPIAPNSSSTTAATTSGSGSSGSGSGSGSSGSGSGSSGSGSSGSGSSGSGSSGSSGSGSSGSSGSSGYSSGGSSGSSGYGSSGSSSGYYSGSGSSGSGSSGSGSSGSSSGGWFGNALKALKL